MKWLEWHAFHQKVPSVHKRTERPGCHWVSTRDASGAAKVGRSGTGYPALCEDTILVLGMFGRRWRRVVCRFSLRRHSPRQRRSKRNDHYPFDDLAAIRGIGIATENRLYRAGIKSYDQLARATPEDVRKILGKLAGGASVEDWIAQARNLASKEKP